MSRHIAFLGAFPLVVLLVASLAEPGNDLQPCCDRAVIEGINARLRLVAKLKEYKESRGMDFVDPEREEWMVRDITRANRGPLSQDGLEEIYAAILDLTKREVS